MKLFTRSKGRKIVGILLLLFLLIQFIPRPEKNAGNTNDDKAIDKLSIVPDSVMEVLRRSCYDCHSNHTNYPWYSNIQPVALYLNRHIVKGKEELNFDDFGSYSRRKQQNKLKSIASQVKDGKMPLGSYKLLHSDARLNKNEKNMIIQWIESIMEDKEVN